MLQQVFADMPSAPGVPADNQATVFLALTCGDAKWSQDMGAYAARSAADRKAWPLTAGQRLGLCVLAGTKLEGYAVDHAVSHGTHDRYDWANGRSAT